MIPGSRSVKICQTHYHRNYQFRLYALVTESLASTERKDPTLVACYQAFCLAAATTLKQKWDEDPIPIAEKIKDDPQFFCAHDATWENDLQKIVRHHTELSAKPDTWEYIKLLDELITRKIIFDPNTETYLSESSSTSVTESYSYSYSESESDSESTSDSEDETDDITHTVAVTVVRKGITTRRAGRRRNRASGKSHTKKKSWFNVLFNGVVQ